MAASGVGSKMAAFWNHPAGPKTIHFWAPTFKWGLVVAGLADINRPIEKVSTNQQCALAATGMIWCRYATQIIPINYNLMSVNFFVALTGLYQLGRKQGLIKDIPIK
uniref:Mitochondrial pyruvate carrier n=1 Tax=Hemiselmis tepida TaxID=464990 RepID=A0A7S0YHZ0_9CRYP|mmetsp:Transcript_11001/g.28573  ORF Transcript_11001/g.28573 Transcript_11001/m.28573 type:complete len:107 (+) Transcript_11001:42-362(+)